MEIESPTQPAPTKEPLCSLGLAPGYAPFYRDEYVTLYHGDCRQIVPQLGKFDLLLTDPPYGINESSKKQKSRQGHGLANQRDYGE